jgi:tRNA threonylcarbamoyl adenosine modification protein YeaZ
LVLAVDTSTPACSVALVEVGPASSASPGPEGAVAVHGRAARRVVDARRHGELLAPLIHEVLAVADVRPADLGGLVVGLGPGPFTSLRVGIVTAATFGAALGLPCHGVCSLDGIGAATRGRVGVALDARRREVFWASYADGRRTAGPAVDYPARAAELLRAAGAAAVTGPGRALYPEPFTGFATGEALHDSRADGAAPSPVAAGPPDYPDPVVLAALAAPDLLAGRPPGPLAPIYLRRPDVAEPHPAKPVTV